MAKKKKKIPTPRNPFVAHLVNKRGGGIHQKPYKTERRDSKLNVKRISLVDDLQAA